MNPMILTEPDYSIEPADSGEVCTTVNDGSVRLEVIDAEQDAQVFLNATEARHLALRLLALAEQLEA